MPIFFQHQINETTRLGIWKIEETEEFFLRNVPLQNQVTHPHKRLQHLAGRFLLQFLFPQFPYDLIRIADTRKPYLRGEEYHFSISHCGDYAAALVSSEERVGIDIETLSGRAEKIKNKFLSLAEQKIFLQGSGSGPAKTEDLALITLLWSVKEAVYKWYGNGELSFQGHIQLTGIRQDVEQIDCLFTKTGQRLHIHYRYFDHIALAWVTS